MCVLCVCVRVQMCIAVSYIVHSGPICCTSGQARPREGCTMQSFVMGLAWIAVWSTGRVQHVKGMMRTIDLSLSWQGGPLSFPTLLLLALALTCSRNNI